MLGPRPRPPMPQDKPYFPHRLRYEKENFRPLQRNTSDNSFIEAYSAPTCHRTGPWIGLAGCPCAVRSDLERKLHALAVGFYFTPYPPPSADCPLRNSWRYGVERGGRWDFTISSTIRVERKRRVKNGTFLSTVYVWTERRESLCGGRV